MNLILSMMKKKKFKLYKKICERLALILNEPFNPYIIVYMREEKNSYAKYNALLYYFEYFFNYLEGISGKQMTTKSVITMFKIILLQEKFEGRSSDNVDIKLYDAYFNAVSYVLMQYHMQLN